MPSEDPGDSVKDTSSTAVWSPYRLRSPRTTSSSVAPLTV